MLVLLEINYEKIKKKLISLKNKSDLVIISDILWQQRLCGKIISEVGKINFGKFH